MGLLPDEASSLLVVAVSTAVFYVISVAGLRLAGRRTLAEMSAFDWVVTVAIGSMIANASLNPSVSVAEGTAGLATLLTLQGLVAAVRRRSGKARRLTDFEPVILVHDGQVSERGLDRLQMTRADLMSKLRQQGTLSLDDLRFVIAEPTGDITVVPSGTRLDTTQQENLQRVVEQHPEASLGDPSRET